MPSNVAGRTKKTVTATVLFIAYCVGNAIGAQMFVASDAPKYVRGITACAVLYLVEFCSMGMWRFYCELCRPVTVPIKTDEGIQISGKTEDEPGLSKSKVSQRRRASALER